MFSLWKYGILILQCLLSSDRDHNLCWVNYYKILISFCISPFLHFFPSLKHQEEKLCFLDENTVFTIFIIHLRGLDFYSYLIKRRNQIHILEKCKLQQDEKSCQRKNNDLSIEILLVQCEISKKYFIFYFIYLFILLVSVSSITVGTHSVYINKYLLSSHYLEGGARNCRRQWGELKSICSLKCLLKELEIS